MKYDLSPQPLPGPFAKVLISIGFCRVGGRGRGGGGGRQEVRSCVMSLS